MRRAPTCPLGRRRLPSSYHSERDSAAADLLLFGTDEFVSHLEKRLAGSDEKKEPHEDERDSVRNHRNLRLGQHVDSNLILAVFYVYGVHKKETT